MTLANMSKISNDRNFRHTSKSESPSPSSKVKFTKKIFSKYCKEEMFD